MAKKDDEEEEKRKRKKRIMLLLFFYDWFYLLYYFIILLFIKITNKPKHITQSIKKEDFILNNKKGGRSLIKLDIFLFFQ